MCVRELALVWWNSVNGVWHSHPRSHDIVSSSSAPVIRKVITGIVTPEAMSHCLV